MQLDDSVNILDVLALSSDGSMLYLFTAHIPDYNSIVTTYFRVHYLNGAFMPTKLQTMEYGQLIEIRPWYLFHAPFVLKCDKTNIEM
jgi:hypothetical protein